jgi:hypothetical protein
LHCWRNWLTGRGPSAGNCAHGPSHRRTHRTRNAANQRASRCACHRFGNGRNFDVFFLLLFVWFVGHKLWNSFYFTRFESNSISDDAMLAAVAIFNFVEINKKKAPAVADAFWKESLS